MIVPYCMYLIHIKSLTHCSLNLLRSSYDCRRYWQDWKYTSFVVTSRQSAMCRDELVVDFLEKHWIETPIFKIIFNPFTFTSYKFYYQMNSIYKRVIIVSKVLHQSTCISY